MMNRKDEPGERMNRILLKVETYAGYKADERPVSFTLKDRAFHVAEILDRWYGADHPYFKVAVDDGNTYTIRHDLELDEWEMVQMEAALRPGPTGAGI